MQTILIVGKFYPPYFGGIELVTKQCADALSARYNVVVICHNTSNVTAVEQSANLTIIRCSTPFAPFRQPISFSMAKQIFTCRADLIHFHAPNFWAAALVGLLRPRVPLVITHHADVEGRALLKAALMPLYKLLLHRSKKIIVSSIKNYRLSTDLDCDERKIVEIPFGLNPDLYTLADRRVRRGGSETNSINSVVFGFCGRFVWYKGLEILLKAFQKVDNARLLLVGDGPLTENIKALAVELRVGDRVEFHGRVSDERKYELFKEMDVFVLPSTDITETFGISQMEAQMSGIPCISSNLPTGVSDVVDHEVTGLLVEPRNVEELERSMRKMVTDAEFRMKCGREARLRAIRLFSEQAFGQKYLALIAQTMEPDSRYGPQPTVQEIS